MFLLLLRIIKVFLKFKIMLLQITIMLRLRDKVMAVELNSSGGYGDQSLVATGDFYSIDSDAWKFTFVARFSFRC